MTCSTTPRRPPPAQKRAGTPTTPAPARAADYTTYAELAALNHDLLHHAAQSPHLHRKGLERLRHLQARGLRLHHLCGAGTSEPRPAPPRPAQAPSCTETGWNAAPHLLPLRLHHLCGAGTSEPRPAPPRRAGSLLHRNRLARLRHLFPLRLHLLMRRAGGA